MEEELAGVYYDPSNPLSYSGASPFIKHFKSKYHPNQLKDWLGSQDTYTLHKPARKRFPRNRYVVYRINELWQADLNDMRGLKEYNDGYGYLLTIIDVFSKKLYTKALRQKTAKEVIRAFTSIFEEFGVKPKNIQSDKGTEFVAKDVRMFLKANKVNYFTTKNPDVKAAVVERVNRTLKSRMWRYLTYKNTYRYIDVLDRLVEAYNNSKHRSIKMAPNEVNVKNSFRVWMNLYGSPTKHSKPKYKLGDHVKISKNKGTFEKGYETNWSDETFVITRVHKFPIPLYSIKDLNQESIDGMFYEHELQKVLIESDRVYKVDKIVDTRGSGRSKKYLVKWVGYSDAFNTWIRAEDLKKL